LVSKYAIKPIKGSKDSANNLVSNKLETKMARWVGAQSQVKLAKKAKPCLHCDADNPKPKSK